MKLKRMAADAFSYGVRYTYHILIQLRRKRKQECWSSAPSQLKDRSDLSFPQLIFLFKQVRCKCSNSNWLPVACAGWFYTNRRTWLYTTFLMNPKREQTVLPDTRVCCLRWWFVFSCWFYESGTSEATSSNIHTLLLLLLRVRLAFFTGCIRVGFCCVSKSDLCSLEGVWKGRATNKWNPSQH
jgi:hypothetical protein